MTIVAERPVSTSAEIKHLKRLETESIGIMREVVLQVGRDNETLTVRVLSVDRTRFLKAPKLH